MTFTSSNTRQILNGDDPDIIVNPSWAPEMLDAILKIEAACFPPSWMPPDLREFYDAALRDTECINVFLLQHRQPAGYALAVRHDDALEFLRPADPLLRPDETLVYLETIQIVPALQGMGYGRRLLMAVMETAWQQGFRGLSMHARCSNEFNRMARRVSMPKVFRIVENWIFGGNETFEYIELAIPDFSSARREQAPSGQK